MKNLAVAAAVAAVIALGVVSGAALADGHHGNKHDDSGQALPTTVTVDTGPGVKPSDTTRHDTSCTTGGGQGASATCSSTTSTNADASKRYGNGRTAPQIANGHGAPAGTQVKGPGNSQPHKVCRNGHWVDVHAARSYDQSGCTTTTAAATTTVGTTTTLAGHDDDARSGHDDHSGADGEHERAADRRGPRRVEGLDGAPWDRLRQSVRGL